MDLFIKSVRPISTYVCENLNQIPTEKTIVVTSGDKQVKQLHAESAAKNVHLTVFRNILGLSNKTSYPGELGE